MALFWRSFGPFPSTWRRSGTGGVRGWTDLRPPERKPLMCQALRLGILPVSQPTSGLGSRVSDRLSDRGTHASNGRSPGEGPVGHHASKGGRFVRREASASKGGRFFSKGGHLPRVLPSNESASLRAGRRDDTANAQPKLERGPMGISMAQVSSLQPQPVRDGEFCVISFQGMG